MEQNLQEQIEKILRETVWGLVCPCGGGGVDYDTEDNEICATCNGTGIHDWRYEFAAEKLIDFFSKNPLPTKD